MAARRSRWFRRWPVITLALAGLFLSAGFWNILDKQRTARLSDLLHAEAGYRVKLLRRDLSLRVLSMTQLGRLWSANNGLSQDTFQNEAMRHIESVPGLRAIGFLDATGIARFVAPSAGSRALGRNIAQASPERLVAFNRAMSTGKPALTDPVDLVDGSGKGLIVFVPVSKNGAPLGVLSTVFNVNAWIESAKYHEEYVEVDPNFSHLVAVNGVTAFEFDGHVETLPDPSVSRTLDVFGNQLSVQVRPGAQFASAHRGIAPELAAMIVLLSISGAGLCLILANRAWQAEQTARQANERLTENVSRLNAEMSERRQAEARARSAREATSRFLTTMSHEIRTPLNAIMGMFQLIAKADVPDRQKRQAAGGLLASQRLFRELTNVLDVSRIDAGAMTILPRDVETAHLLEDWFNILEGLVQKSDKPLDLKLEKAPDLPKIVCLDPVRLGQIVTNLLDNAVKFTPSGEIRLRLTMDEMDMVLEVIDSGPGLKADDFEAVFQRFYQVHDGMARSYEGSGLGLSISRDLAALMQATLTVENGAKGGSIFTFRLFNVSERDITKTRNTCVPDDQGTTPA
ncbi:MAG: ATP-binding protein [Sedimentitalea sp.]